MQHKARVAVEIPMIRHRHRRHPRVRRLLHHIINSARPIERGILSVEVQMDKLLRQISGIPAVERGPGEGKR